LGPFGPGAFSASDSASSTASSSDPYSLTIVVQITHPGQGNSSFNADLTTVPEPASMLTWGGLIGLVGLAYARQRRKRRIA
jgi:hypothetical protein